VTVDEDGETESLPRPGEGPRDRVVISGVERRSLLPLRERQRAGEGGRTGRGHRPDEAAAVDVARMRVLGHRAARDVVRIAVEIADEARQPRSDVDLGGVGLADAIEAIDEQIGVAPDVELGRHRLLEAGRTHPGVRHAQHHRRGRFGGGARDEGAFGQLEHRLRL
jgi:hypothetical protein